MPDFKPNKTQRELIGLVPAGGLASRVAPLPGSKELYPIGFRPVEDGSLRPKVVCHYLLENMRLAGAHKAYIVLRKGKWDIPAYFGDGTMLDMQLAYLIMGAPWGVPFTLDQAYPFVKEALILLGFPDVLLQPADAFLRLLARQDQTQAEAVLGLFPTAQPHTADMVELTEEGRVREIIIKPAHSNLTYTWMIAVWTPVFTQFMHDYLEAVRAGDTPFDLNQKELFTGHMVQAAIDEGLTVDAVLFPDGQCLDIGIPDNLVRAVRAYQP